MVRATSSGLLLALLLASCGGRTHTGGGGSEGPKVEPNGPSDDPSDDDQSDGSSAEGDTPLGDCQLGPKARPTLADPCPWLADGRCYEAREMACNCICPRSKDSQCLSGFEGGPNSRVEVFCQ